MAEIDAATFRQQRIEKTQALIVAYEDAILALSTGAQTYQLDTGQTRTLVTKANLSSLREMLCSLEARLDTYLAQRDGGSVYVRPGF